MVFSRQNPLVPEVFRVLVPADGFRWIEVFRRIGRRTVVERQLAPESPPWRMRATFPLRDMPTLCRTFAALEPDREAILAFANEHGELCGDGVQRWPPADDSSARRGENLAEWSRAILDVRDALGLVDAGRAKRDRDARRLVSWRGRVASVEGHDPMQATDDESRQLKAVYYLRPGDSRQAAMFFAQRIINKELEEHTTLRLYWHPERETLELRARPKNLLGVLWIQVAWAAEGAVEHRPCAAPGCAAWFAVAPGGGHRSDKATCSERCRKRRERSRAKPNPSRRRA
jgi:hypothetical protein